MPVCVAVELPKLKVEPERERAGGARLLPEDCLPCCVDIPKDATRVFLDSPVIIGSGVARPVVRFIIPA